jgi:hypothetical protein
MALLPLLQWHCHHPQASIVTLVAMALLSSLMRKPPRCHCNGIVALVVMALLSLMCRHLHHHCDGNHHPLCDDVSAILQSPIQLIPWQTGRFKTLSCLVLRLYRVLSLAIHNSPNNGRIDLLSSEEMITLVFSIHFAL